MVPGKFLCEPDVRFLSPAIFLIQYGHRFLFSETRARFPDDRFCFPEFQARFFDDRFHLSKKF